MPQVHKKITFRVYYKVNPDYAGEYNLDRLTDQNDPNHFGLHGEFQTVKKAEDAKAKCEKYFKEENILGERVNEKTKKAEVVIVRTVIHDNVIVWIEKYEDGEEVPWQEKPEESEKPKKKKELQTA